MSRRFSRAIEKAIYQRDSGRCAICGRETEFDDGEIEHKIPSSKGGDDDPKNLQWACHRCNKLKGSKLTNEQVRGFLGLPEDYEETLELANRQKSIMRTPIAECKNGLPVLSQEGLDTQVIDKCIQCLQESYQRQTIIPEIYGKISSHTQNAENFVNIGFHYQLPRDWFLPFEQTEQAYYNEPMFESFGKEIAMGERHYLQDTILRTDGVPHIEIDFSSDGILRAISEMRKTGFEPNVITTPIKYWIEMQIWMGSSHVEYSQISPKPVLDSSLVLDGCKLNIISPLGDFPKESLLFSRQAIAWHVKKYPDQNALYVVLGNHELYNLKYVELLTGTEVKCEVMPKAIMILNFK